MWFMFTSDLGRGSVKAARLARLLALRPATDWIWGASGGAFFHLMKWRFRLLLHAVIWLHPMRKQAVPLAHCSPAARQHPATAKVDLVRVARLCQPAAGVLRATMTAITVVRPKPNTVHKHKDMCVPPVGSGDSDGVRIIGSQTEPRRHWHQVPLAAGCGLA